MSDSSDYSVCEICRAYEICLIVTATGLESGLFYCENGHIVCKNCIGKKTLDKYADKVYGDPEFVRGELNKYISEINGKPRKSSSELENVKELSRLLSLSDKTLLEEVKEDDLFGELFSQLPSSICPLCSRKVINDKVLLEYLIEKSGRTKEELIKEVKNECNS